MDKKYFLAKIKKIVQQSAPGATLILYGSRARGDEKKDSDWDLLVLLNKENITLQDEQKIRHPLYELELETETGFLISTLIYSAKEWEEKLPITPLYEKVKKEGVVLHEAA